MKLFRFRVYYLLILFLSHASANASVQHSHWTKGFTEQYGNAAQTRQVALTDVTGPGTGYLNDLDAVAKGDVTYGDKAELLDVQYREVTKQAGVLTKAAIVLASGGNAWLSFGLNTLADAAISGEIDLENIAKDAAFTYVSGGIQNSSADFGSQQWLTDTAVRAAKEGTLQTVIYGGSLKDNILNSATQIVVNDATALAQGQIHDIKAENFWGEGSVPGALLHGGVGGLASLAKDGDFAAGFVAAAGAEFTTGFVHKQTGGDQTRTGEIIRKYTNPTLAALTSGGDVGQYSINQSISDSQLQYNFWGRGEEERMKEAAKQMAAADAAWKDKNCQGLSEQKCRAAFNGYQRDQLSAILGIGTMVAAGQCLGGIDGACKDIMVNAATDAVAGGIATGAVIAVKIGGKWVVRKIDDVRRKAKGTVPDGVSFGRNANQDYHVWRHIEDELGTSRQRVQDAVVADLPSVADLSSGLNVRFVNVDGVRLQYNAFKLPDGTVNIGRIHEAN